VPDEVDGIRVEFALRGHFPRSIVAAIANVDFEGVDFDTPTTLAGLKVELNKLKARSIQLRNRTVAAARAVGGVMANGRRVGSGAALDDFAVLVNVELAGWTLLSLPSGRLPGLAAALGDEDE
jgi:hypothetical protein